MEQKPCVFCGIASKQIPAKIVYEDDNATAFLDIAPRSKGMCIVAARQHYKEFDERMELSNKILQSALVVAEMIKQALKPKSVSFSIISSEAVPHFHVRLYPIYENEMPLIESQPLQTTEQELNEIAEKIRAVRIEIKKKEEEKEGIKEEAEEEKPIEHTEEEAYWIKRRVELA